MMKSAEPGTGDHHRRRRGPVLYVTCLSKRVMNPIPLVINDVFSQEPAKMAFVHRDDVGRGSLSGRFRPGVPRFYSAREPVRSSVDSACFNSVMS